MNILNNNKEVKFMMHLFRLIGMGPYSLGESEEDAHLSKASVVYNIVLAAAIIINAYFAEEDPTNNGSYSNKTIVVDTAFTVVDCLGIIYVTLNMMVSIFRRRIACSLFYESIKLHQRFKIMGIFFNKKSKYLSVFLHMTLGVLWPSTCIAVIIFLETSANIRYSLGYRVVVFYPVIIASVMMAFFTHCTYGLYQKLWVINQMLRSISDAYCARMKKKNGLSIAQANFGYEKNLEEIIFARITSSDPRKIKWASPQNLPEPDPIITKPYLIFIDNFPKCFEQTGKDAASELRALRAVHFQIREVADIVADIFGPHFIVLYTWYFFAVIINVYASVTFQITGDIEQEYAASVTWTVIWSLMALLPVLNCNQTTAEARQTLTVVHKFWTRVDSDLELKGELQAFATQIAQSPMEFTAAGFFTINSALLFSFVVAIVGNVIFIIQFDKLNLNTGTTD